MSVKSGAVVDADDPTVKSDQWRLEGCQSGLMWRS